MNHEVELVTSRTRTKAIIDGMQLDGVKSYSAFQELHDLYRVPFTILAENARLYEELPLTTSEED